MLALWQSNWICFPPRDDSVILYTSWLSAENTSLSHPKISIQNKLALNSELLFTCTLFWSLAKFHIYIVAKFHHCYICISLIHIHWQFLPCPQFLFKRSHFPQLMLYVDSYAFGHRLMLIETLLSYAKPYKSYKIIFLAAKSFGCGNACRSAMPQYFRVNLKDNKLMHLLVSLVTLCSPVVKDHHAFKNYVGNACH